MGSMEAGAKSCYPTILARHEAPEANGWICRDPEAFNCNDVDSDVRMLDAYSDAEAGDNTDESPSVRGPGRSLGCASVLHDHAITFNGVYGNLGSCRPTIAECILQNRIVLPGAGWRLHGVSNLLWMMNQSWRFKTKA